MALGASGDWTVEFGASDGNQFFAGGPNANDRWNLRDGSVYRWDETAWNVELGDQALRKCGPTAMSYGSQASGCIVFPFRTSRFPALAPSTAGNTTPARARSRKARPGRQLARKDRGCQYTSAAFRQRLREAGIDCSMSRKGNCYDNAVAESFFATLEVECLHRTRFETRADAKAVTVDLIEHFYNPERIHSALGFMSPNEYEQQQLALVA